MKITKIDTEIVALPADDPLADTVEKPGKRLFVTLTVETSDGVTGIAATTFGGPMTGALRKAVDELGALIIGDDPLRPEAVVRKLRTASGHAGPAGIFTLALSAIDIALWDIKGRAANLPLWKLLGGFRERVPTYASGALTRDLSMPRLEVAARKLIDKGFREMKTQLALPGDTNPFLEVERARTLRQIIGPEIKLMCDINQRWRPEQAMDIGKRIEDAGVGFFWLEDATAPDDHRGLARIAAALTTPLASGEYVYGTASFRHMIEAHSIDIAMVDLLRVGGITQWLKVAAMAESFNLPVVSHLLPEVHVHLIAAVPNGLTVEYMPWSSRLYEEVPQPIKGELVVPTTPGLGLKFSTEAIKHYKVS